MDFIYSIKYINCPILLSLTLLPLCFENLRLNGNLNTNKAINTKSIVISQDVETKDMFCSSE